MKNLDKLLHDSKPGDAIWLEPGIYITEGVEDIGAGSKGKRLKAGCSLKAQEPGQTIITMLRRPSDRSYTVLLGEGGNRVEGLIIDGGLTEMHPFKLNGIYLPKGAPNTIQQCHVARIGGNAVMRKESFAISAIGPLCRISRCTVAGLVGDYTTAYQATGGTITDCHYDMPTEGAFLGFNPPGCDILHIVNCTGVGGRSAIYNDYGNITDLMVVACYFSGCRFGLHLNAQETADSPARIVQDVNVSECHFALHSEADHVAALLIDNTPLPFSRKPTSKNLIAGVGFFQNVVAAAPPATRRVVQAANIATTNDGSKPDSGIRAVEMFDNEWLGRFAWRNYGGNAKEVLGQADKWLLS